MVQTSYLPLCQTLNEMIRLSKRKFRCGLAITGTTLDLLEQYAPEMIDQLKQLAGSGCVEMVAMPYSYSLASETDESEWEEQLRNHANKIKEMFDISSTTLWNTELLYSDDTAAKAWQMGYKVLMTEGAEHILSWKSPNYVYATGVNSKQKLLVRNMNLSDMISFHFSDTTHPAYPMDAEKFIHLLLDLPQEQELVNIWMGAETFGVLQPASTGIFDFLKALPYFALEQNIGFVTPTEAAKTTAAEVMTVPYPISWAGGNKDISLFTGNDLQQEALSKLYAVGERVRLCEDKRLKEDWHILQDANYLHYMNHVDHGNSNYESAYDAFINYMNILADFLQRVDEQYPTTIENEELNSLLKTIRNQEKEIASLQEQMKALKRRKKQ